MTVPVLFLLAAVVACVIVWKSVSVRSRLWAVVLGALVSAPSLATTAKVSTVVPARGTAETLPAPLT